MHAVIEKNKEHYEKTLEFFQQDITSLRTGRISPSIVEGIGVESYGATTELMQLASITSPEPQSITIKPWDKSILKDIEKALSASDLNVNPVVDGEVVRLNFPPLTEESRKELVKSLHKKAEDSRITLRSQREKIKEEVMSLEKAKEITEDDRFQALKDLDVLTKEYNDKIKLISDKKKKK